MDSYQIEVIEEVENLDNKIEALRGKIPNTDLKCQEILDDMTEIIIKLLSLHVK